MLDTVLPNEPAPGQSSEAQARRRLGRRAIFKGIGLAALAMLLAECLRIFVGSNLHEVVPGKCYRSAQPTASLLESAERTYHIRSIVNLRDENEDESWYQEEKESARRLGLSLINAGLSSKEQAPDEDFRKFVQAMKDAPEPILIHCANGNDRTGLASAVYLMMRTDTPIREARRQLSLRYGHIAWSKASCLGRVLDSYESWLLSAGLTHHADQFYFWGMNIYRQETIVN